MTKPAADRRPPTWRSVRDLLLREKDRIVAEIHAYPPPIAGCDAQYQHLTERRRLVAQELARLQAAEAGGAAALDEFIRTSAFIDAAAARRLRSA